VISEVKAPDIKIIWMVITPLDHVIVQESKTNNLYVFDINLKILKTFNGVPGISPEKENVRTCKSSINTEIILWMKGNQHLTVICAITFEIKLEIQDFFQKGIDVMPLMAISNSELSWAVGISLNSKTDTLALSHYSKESKLTKKISPSELIANSIVTYNFSFRNRSIRSKQYPELLAHIRVKVQQRLR